MKSAGNRGIVQSRLQVLHVHVFLVAPLGACHVAKSGADQHQGGVVIGECLHHAGTAADLPVQPLDHIVGPAYSTSDLAASHIAVAILSDLWYSFCEPLGSLLYMMIFSTTIIFTGALMACLFSVLLFANLIIRYLNYLDNMNHFRFREQKDEIFHSSFAKLLCTKPI